MSSDWPRAKFEQLCDIKRGASPRPIHEWLSATGVPWVKISDATSSELPYISKTSECIKSEGKTKSVEVFPGDLILSNSATPGIPKFMDIHACIHDGWLLLRNFRGLDKWYAYYLLKTERENLIRQGNGSVFTNLKTEILKNLEVTLPPIAHQQKIAEILKSLDDRISLLRETNKNLEDIARTIFKSWFIDYEPVHAKLQGNTSNTLRKEIVDLFPNSFTETSLGQTPLGWQVQCLGDWIDILETGRRPKGGVGGIENGVPSIGAESILKVGEFDYKKIRYVSHDFFEKMKSGKLQTRDVLLYKDGGKPGSFLPRVSMFGDGFPFDVCGINEHVFRIRLKPPFGQSFLYFWLWSDNVMHELKQRGGKAAIPGINQSDVKDLKLAVPNPKILTAFEDIASPMISKILSNSKQIKTLSDVRDNILPKLISGQLSIDNVLSNSSTQ